MSLAEPTPSQQPQAVPTQIDSSSSTTRVQATIPPHEDDENSFLSNLFFGDDGLRAGWSLALFALILVALSFAINAAITHFHLLPRPSPNRAHQPMSPRRTIVNDGVDFLLLALASLLMSLVERRPLARFGLGLRRALPDFLAGLCWGFTALSALIGVLRVTHSIAFDGIALHGAQALLSAGKWAAAFLLVGLFEEFFTRGYIQYTVARGVAGLTRALSPGNRHSHVIGFCIAAFLFSVCLFMVGHIGNPGETTAGILAVGLAGAVFAFSLYRTGTLWWAIGMHAAWDWAQTFFYGVSDSGIPAVGHLFNSHPIGRELLSGGSTGPEGSLFVIPTLLLLALVIHLTLPRRAYPLTPDQSPDRTPPAAPSGQDFASKALHI